MTRPFRGVVPLVRLEIGRYRAIFPVALALGAAAAVVPRIPGPHRTFGDDGWIALVIVFASGLGVFLLAPIAASTWSRGLSTGALAYLFARPLSVATIGLARFLATIVVVGGALLLIWAPAQLLNANHTLFAGWNRGRTVQLLVLTPFAALGLALALGTLNGIALHLRRPGRWSGAYWLVVGVAAVAYAIFRSRFGPNETSSVDGFVLPVVVFAFAAASLAGVVLQLRSGRGDLRRSQRAHALTVLLLSSAGLAAAGAGAWRFLHPHPTELAYGVVRQARVSTSGRLLLGGSVGWGSAYFIVDTGSGRWTQIPRSAHGWGSPEIFWSDTSGAAVWAEWASDGAGDAQWWYLEPFELRPVRLSFDGGPESDGVEGDIVALSPDGKTLAVAGRDVRLLDLSSRTTICSAPLPPGRVRSTGTEFRSDTNLWVDHLVEEVVRESSTAGVGGRPQVSFFWLDSSTCTLRDGGALPTSASAARIAIDPERLHAAVLEPSNDSGLECPDTVVIYDIRRRRRESDFALAPLAGRCRRDLAIRFASSERIVATWSGDASGEGGGLLLMDLDGTTLLERKFDREHVRVVAQFQNSRFLTIAAHDEASYFHPGGWVQRLADLYSLEIQTSVLTLDRSDLAVAEDGWNARPGAGVFAFTPDTRDFFLSLAEGQWKPIAFE